VASAVAACFVMQYTPKPGNGRRPKSRYDDMKIYGIIKGQHSSTNLLYVVANGYVLSELGRISRSLKRKTQGEKFYGGNIKTEVTELTATF
jgi:triphosphoribosyl-dephospho-CoA synthetase